MACQRRSVRNSGADLGTVYTLVLALIAATAFGVATAIFLSEGFLGTAVFGILKRFGLQLSPFWNRVPDQLERVLKGLIELLAAIPSVVYGLWGLFVVIPLIRPVCHWLHSQLGWVLPAVVFVSREYSIAGADTSFHSDIFN